VAAGFDRFPPELIERYLRGYSEQKLRIPINALLALGRQNGNDGAEPFNMAYLAVRGSGGVNGVSRLHGEVTKQMWQPIWPNTPYERLPVKSLTNGVHVPTWMSAEMTRLLERYVGDNWLEMHDDPSVADRVMQIPDEELWEARRALRNYLFNFVRERARLRWTTENVGAARVVAAGTMFDSNTRAGSPATSVRS
jgi:starch phosphorylase